ncbi:MULTISPECIES: hypothetical protein [unclassified Streptomyces]|uniref:hypothetical protein n=1 Tax=unclassified Streptomyces TaxID=2593676 RepID=UPI000DD82721|nr:MULTISPECIES: hypothetical protein [unclassified Streptomyces]QZZ25808.1 hypothetical protein A7X85_05685 [Streptomyces sp. ST1015]
MVIILSPAHVHLCLRHQLWTRSTHDISLVSLPEVIGAQHRLGHLARRYRRIRQALDLARKIVEDWSATGMPTALDPKDLYLATTAELSRRFARIYTPLGTQAPLYRRFCLCRERDFRESQVV